MTTSYCSLDQWAVRRGYTNWATFSAAKSFPEEEMLEDFLEDATEIMNDMEHIGCGSTNITDTEYTPRLQRICYNMANRMLQTQNVTELQGGNLGIQNWSQADFLMTYERTFLINIGIIKGHRSVGGVR